METRIQQKIDINELDNLDARGFAPIHYAVISGNLTFVKFLVEEGKVNVNIFSSTKMSPLMIAISSKNIGIFEYLLNKNAITNTFDENGITLLIFAARIGNWEIFNKIFALNQFNINDKSKEGFSALSAAVGNGNTKIVEQLLSCPSIDLSGTFQYGDTLYEIAQKYSNDEIKKLLLARSGIGSYLNNLLEMPTAKSWKKYFGEAKHLGTKHEPLTETESNRIKARLTWSEVVSKINAAHEIKGNMLTQTLITRFKNLGIKNADESFIRECIEYIQTNSRIILTFNAGAVLKDGLIAYRPLNVFENNPQHKQQKYFDNRKKTEEDMFKYLDPSLIKKLLSDDISARPKYASLMLGNIAPVYNYGQSFVVLQDTVKFNSLFNVGDSMDSKFNKYIDLEPTTYHHLDLFLYQAGNDFLLAIAAAARTGKFPENYNQQYDATGQNGYIEVMIPQVNLLDCSEHIHIDSSEFKLSENDIQALKDRKISFTNSSDNPFTTAKEKLFRTNATGINDILKSYPGIMIMLANYEKESLIEIAVNKNIPSLGKLLQLSHYNPDKKERGMTKLHMAAGKSAHNIFSLHMKFLIEELNADINAKMESKEPFYDGMSPIMFCMASNHTPATKMAIDYLLKKGADLNVKNSVNDTLLTIASGKDRTDYIILLLKKRLVQLEKCDFLTRGLIYNEICLVYLRAICFDNSVVIELARKILNDKAINIDSYFYQTVNVLMTNKPVYSDTLGPFIEVLRQTMITMKQEIFFGYLMNQYSNPSLKNRISELELNDIFCGLIKMQAIQLMPAKEKCLGAYFSYVNYKQQSPADADHKRAHEAEEKNTWGDKKTKQSVQFFSNNADKKIEDVESSKSYSPGFHNKGNSTQG